MEPNGTCTDSPYMDYFRDKTIFLTGATGNLGSCIVYKLVTALQFKKLYVLVRGSKEKALQQWRRTMPSHARNLETTAKIQFVIGDMLKPGFGIQVNDIAMLKKDAEIVIHSAANISLIDPIVACMRNNCEPVLELARLSTTFAKLEKFVLVSSAFANSHCPDGLVKEKIYPLLDSTGEDIDAELERDAISRSGSSSHTKRFAWPYAFSKYLAERLLLERFASLPLLIVRSSSIGPALYTPFRHFGSEQSLPMNHVLKVYLRDPEGSKKWHAVADSFPGTNIIDEVPVDWVGNVILLHIASQTVGIVHACAGVYVKQTADDLINTRFGRSEELQKVPGIEWIAKDSGPQGALANFVAMANRDWDFSCQRSAKFREIDGPLSLHVTFEEARVLNEERFVRALREVEEERASN